MTLEFNQAEESVISIDNVIGNIDLSLSVESSSVEAMPVDVVLSSSNELNIEVVLDNQEVPLSVVIEPQMALEVAITTNDSIDFTVDVNTDTNKGDKGDTGEAGPQGPRGPRGDKGDRGDLGATGVTGPAGSTGLDGVKGDKGDKGDLGLTGAKGDKGDQGNQGFKGDKGDTGPAGVKGDQGVQGIQGRDGLTTSVNGVTQIDGNVTLTKSDIGLGNVDDTSDLNKPISTATQSALDLKLGLNTPIAAGSNSKITYDSNGLVLSSSKADISDITDLASALSNKLETSLKGAANGLAELDSSGFVKNTQLPSYVDDVLEYSSLSLFPVVGESGKIYIDTTTNLTYRWSGSTYALVSQSLALGETSSTAYRGDRGKTAYDHSQILSGNPHGTVYGWTEITSKPTTLSGYGITDAIQNQQSAAQTGGLWVSQLIKTSYGITVLHAGNDNPSVAPFINFQDPSFSVSNSISMNSAGGLSVNNYQSGVGAVKTFTISKEGDITSLGYYTGTQYKVIGGTSSQYLKADGSLDANTYQPLGTAINVGNIAGQSVNYANVSGNATNWSGYELDFDQAVSVNRLIAFDSSDNTFRVADAPSIKSWLGLGSSAYTNTSAFLSSGGGTLSGRLTINSATFPSLIFQNTDYPGCTGQLLTGANNDVVIRNVGSTNNYDLRWNDSSIRWNNNTIYHSGNLNPILNQKASAQSANMWISGQARIGGNFSLGELYYSDLKGLALPLGTETWLKLATIQNNSTVRFQIRVGSSNSEEMSEVKIFGTYHINQTGIIVERQTYYEHLREVRVTGSDGGNKTIYIRLRSNDSAPSLNWRIIECKGAPTIHNVVEIPSAGQSQVITGNLSINTNVGINVNGPVGIGTTLPDTGKLVILKNSTYNNYTGAGLSLQSNAANAYTELQLGADDNVNIGYIQALQKNQNFTTRSLSLNPNGGNVQIGYATDQGYKLAVNGNGLFNGNIYIGSAASYILMGDDDSPSGHKYIHANGNNIGFLDSGGSWSVRWDNSGFQNNTGGAYFGGNVTASNFILSSDRTLKTNIQPIIKDYSRLNLVSFNFKDNLNELRFGTIAQDLLSNGYSEFVTGDKEGEYKVKYIDLIIAKLASAELRIKELEDKYGSR